MKRIHCVCALALLMLASSRLPADEPAAKVPEVAWGKIIPIEAGTGEFALEITDWPAAGKLTLPTPFANITRAYLALDPNRKPLLVECNADATSIVLHLPKKKSADLTTLVALETAEKSEQFVLGRIVLSALDAKVQPGKGQTTPEAKLESHPGNHRIGFWTNSAETVEWNYTATRPGMYEVELTYSGDGNADTEVELKIGEKTLPIKLIDTGSWYKYTTGVAGKVYIPTAGPLSIEVKCTKQTGPAVMNLKAITLRPTCEGKMPEQAEDGTITCHARDVTIQGVKVQYEPKPEKNTVGYWVNEKDWVYWDFKANKPGKYQVEILQGCGEGHGGSEVVLTIAGQKLPFTVKDTGHFQNFKPRMIGTVEIKPGQQRMTVVPVKKAKAAIMDLRQVRLIPVKE
jgi:hypothetical protein